MASCVAYVKGFLGAPVRSPLDAPFSTRVGSSANVFVEEVGGLSSFVRACGQVWASLFPTLNHFLVTGSYHVLIVCAASAGCDDPTDINLL